jgi:recombination protein RecT
MATATPEAPANGIATKKEPTLKQWLEGDQFKERVAKSLPSHIKPDRFARVALNTINQSPGLLKCTIPSVLECLMKLSAYGIEADGRRAHLIPFKKNKKIGDKWIEDCTICTLIIDYKGLAELVMRSGLVSYLHADVVHRGDVFVFNKGVIESHVPWFLRDPAERPTKEGETYAVYAMVKMKDGTEKAEVISLADCYKIRDNSEGYKSFKKGYASQSPWDTAEGEMLKKTAFRRLTKWLPLSPEIRDSLESDEEVPVHAMDVPVASIVPSDAETKSDQLADLLAGGAKVTDIEPDYEGSQESDPEDAAMGLSDDLGEITTEPALDAFVAANKDKPHCRGTNSAQFNRMVLTARCRIRGE